ncbi:glycine zipper family protein [Halobacillus salinus]|uniref:Glycine zipper family protein n=2 Tax=Halobacillus salinus TaxID=192814 RepID=A0A4Z0H9S8_9BACI|nr:glycine zipper family protein [Halobacillus salinus]
MAIGISIGTALGMTVFDNAAIGTSLGLAMGIAIGAGKDEEAKKKGLML